MRPEDLLCPSPKGLYSPIGDFYVDPTRAVPRAVITHGHSDHARAGHAHVLATRETLDIMALRMGPGFAGGTQALAYGEAITINGVTVSLHPAGHVLGSAQVRLEKDGLVIVVSGDYKDAADPTCAPFEVVPCDTFIFPERTHIVGAYSLGKAQRMMALIRRAGHDAPIYVHGALINITDYYQSCGMDFGEILPVKGAPKSAFAGAVVIAPPSSMTDIWARRFSDPITCFASGWMRVRARARQRGVELPLVVSDHADWDGLTASIRATGCEELWVTHGAEDALVHWAHTRQLRARPLHMVGYGEEDEEVATAAPEGEAPAP